jgi:ubiquinone/menaquinone biosynthesis C-methylase UbiE
MNLRKDVRHDMLDNYYFDGGNLLRSIYRVAQRFRGVPPNTLAANLKKWTGYDWSKSGEEWTVSPAWKDSVIREILEPNIPVGSSVLEIGPGGGRWTEHLLPRANSLVVVDLTPECIRLCQERFGSGSKIKYFVNDGRDLSFIPDMSLDRIWSFDVFVHIQRDDIEKYVSQFPRILSHGGVAVIHHAAHGTQQEGWRSDMTTGEMRHIAHSCGLSVVQQFSCWKGGHFNLGDVITILANS